MIQQKQQTVSGKLIIRQQTSPWGKLLFNRLLDQQSTDQSAREASNTKKVFSADDLVLANSRKEILATVIASQASMVLIETTISDCRNVTTFVFNTKKKYPRTRFYLVCFELPQLEAGTAERWRLFFAESGVTGTLTTHREILSLAPIVLSHFAALPLPEISREQAIFNSLPWSNSQQTE